MTSLKTPNKPRSSARSYSLWLLSRKAYATKELHQRLLRRGYDLGEADDAVRYLKEIGYLNDHAYAESYVNTRSQTGHGPRKLRWALASRGIENEVVEGAVSGIDHDSLISQATELAKRKLRDRPLDDEKVRSALVRHLLGRGYEYSQVQEVIQKLSGWLDSEGKNS